MSTTTITNNDTSIKISLDQNGLAVISTLPNDDRGIELNKEDIETALDQLSDLMVKNNTNAIYSITVQYPERISFDGQKRLSCYCAARDIVTNLEAGRAKDLMSCRKAFITNMNEKDDTLVVKCIDLSNPTNLNDSATSTPPTPCSSPAPSPANSPTN